MDYIIVGAGPSGITAAYYLARQGKKCVLIDRQPTIGGCHRVIRVNGMFTEHAPRVFLSSYINTQMFLEDMGISSESLFVPYKFGLWNIMLQLTGNIQTSELAYISWEFTKFMFDPTSGQNTSVLSMMQSYQFSESSIDYIDRLCRQTDGGGADRFSMYQFLSLPNQNLLYTIYQPKYPNDVGLFPAIQSILSQTTIQIKLNTSVQSILMNDDQSRVTGVVIQSNGVTSSIYANNVVLAITPQDLYKIMTSSPCPLAFGPLRNWVVENSYNDDLGATFHWNTKLPITSVWGFPSSEWGVISILSTDYMDLQDPRSLTMISVCITFTDRISTFIGQTANQVSNKDTLLQEMFRQLKETYPTLPPPTTMILSPTIYRDNNRWVEQDSGYFASAQSKPLPSKGTVPNLYQVGPQNGHSPLHITTFEAAVTNAIVFVKQQCPCFSFEIQSPWEIRTLFWLGIFLLVFFIIWLTYRTDDRYV